MHTSKPYTKVAATHFVRCIKVHHVEQGVEEDKGLWNSREKGGALNAAEKAEDSIQFAHTADISD